VRDQLTDGGSANVVFGANMTTLTFAFARAVSRNLAPGDEIVCPDSTTTPDLPPIVADAHAVPTISMRTPTVAFTVGGHHPDEIAKRLADARVAVWSGDYSVLEVMASLGHSTTGGASYNFQPAALRSLHVGQTG
jgi:selenocysteine lyase/cysteine desulfurase